MNNKPVTIKDDGFKAYHDKSVDLYVNKSYEAFSGFKYILGEKSCEGITLHVAIAQGTGISYLCGFQAIFHDQVIAEAIFRNVIYTRDKARRLVGKYLIKAFKDMIKRQKLKGANEKEITKKVNEILDRAYYEESDQASIDLLQSWGIELQKPD